VPLGALSFIMRIILSLLLVFASNAFAKPDTPVDLTTSQVYQLFEEQFVVELKDLPDLVEKENRVASCVEEYVKKQSKSYTKIVQNNLYDLIHNFDKIVSRVGGKKSDKDDIPHEEKIEALAKVQCEAYNAMGVLK
jgi:hypothetical protein